MSDIIITPNRGSTNAPTIQFSGSANASASIRLEVLPEGQVAFLGKSGSLFSISDNMVGSLMAVSDISGLPILEVFSDDKVVMGKYNTNTLVVTGSRIAIGKSNPTVALDVSGSVAITGSMAVSGTATVSGTTTVSAVSATGPISTSATEALRINNDNGYISIFNSAASTRTGYIQGASAGQFTFAAENGAAMFFSTNSSTRMCINTSGNVGIGKSTPNSVLDVNGNTIVTGSLGVFNTADSIKVRASTGTSNLFASFQNTTGRIIIGCESSTAGSLVTGAPAYAGIISSTSGNELHLATGDTSRIMIASGGNVGIGKTTPNAKLDVSGSAIITGSLSVVGDITATGNVTAYYSDDRLKNNLGNIPDSLNKVLSLNGFYFEPNQTAIDFGYIKQKEVGVSAQQVQAILPEIIAAAPIDAQYMTVRYEKLIPLLIEAIKEQNSMIVDLQQKINRL
jgi:hypothetical protein